MVQRPSSMVCSFSPLPLGPCPRADDGGDDVHAQHKSEQDQRRAVLDLEGHLRHLGGDHEQVIGQRHGGIKRRVWQARQEEGCPGEQDGSCLTCGPFQAKNNACDHAGQSLRQDDAADGLPACATQRDTDRAKSLRHRPQGLFGRADDDRQGHDRERQRGRQQAGAKFQEEDEQTQAEQAVNHGGDACQVDDGDADQAGDPVLGGVFRQVDGRGNAQWHRKDGRAERQVKSAHDGRQNAPLTHAVARETAQEFPGDGGCALQDDVNNHSQDGNDGDRHDQGQERKAQLLGKILVDAQTALHQDRILSARFF